jgi:hypothetical protein
MNLQQLKKKMSLQHAVYSRSVPVNGTKDYEGVKIHLHSFLTEQETARTAERV